MPRCGPVGAGVRCRGPFRSKCLHKIYGAALSGPYPWWPWSGPVTQNCLVRFPVKESAHQTGPRTGPKSNSLVRFGLGQNVKDPVRYKTSYFRSIPVQSVRFDPKVTCSGPVWWFPRWPRPVCCFFPVRCNGSSLISTYIAPDRTADRTGN